MNCIIDAILIAALKWLFFAYFLPTAFLTPGPGKSQLSEHDNILPSSLLYVGQHLQIEWRKVDGVRTPQPQFLEPVLHLQKPKAAPHNL